MSSRAPGGYVVAYITPTGTAGRTHRTTRRMAEALASEYRRTGHTIESVCPLAEALREANIHADDAHAVAAYLTGKSHV